jgi:O-antigen/teichoic acid export membrane protein
VKSVFLQTVFWRALSAGSWGFVSLLCLRLISHHLPQSTYGFIGVAIIIAGLLPSFDGGFRTVINRRLLATSEPEGRRRLVEFSQALYLRLSLLFAVAGLIALLLYKESPNVRALGLPLGWFLVVGASGGLLLFTGASVQALIGVGWQRHMSALQVLMAWLTYLCLWGGFKTGCGVWSFVLYLVVPQAVGGILSLLLIRQVDPAIRLLGMRWESVHTALFRELGRDSLCTLRFQVVTLLLYSADAVIASLVCRPTEAGYYILAANVLSKARSMLISADEAVWPIVAGRGEKAGLISTGVLRFNGWLHGAAMAALCLGAPAFLSHFLRNGWGVGSGLIAVLALRCLITGLATQPSFFLFGLGRTDLLTRHLGRELVVAVVLGVPAAWGGGAIGLAMAFLAATGVGSLLPLIHDYAVIAGRTLTGVLRSLWSRAVFGAAICGGLIAVLLPLTPGWWGAAGVTALAFVCALVTALGIAFCRARAAGKVDVQTLAQFI